MTNSTGRYQSYVGDGTYFSITISRRKKAQFLEFAKKQGWSQSRAFVFFALKGLEQYQKEEQELIYAKKE